MFGGPSFEKSNHKEDVAKLRAKFKTNMGEFEVELFHKQAPETVWNFVNLIEGRQETVKEGPFYNGLIFHRVIAGFVIQGGCPEGSGRGGPGYRFGDECTPELKHEGAGILSMANAGPNTNGSQFFVTVAATPWLDGNHSIFGKVVEGMEVVNNISLADRGPSDAPTTKITIDKVTIAD